MEEIVSSRYSSGAFNRFIFPFGEQNNVKNVNVFVLFFLVFQKVAGNWEHK